MSVKSFRQTLRSLSPEDDGLSGQIDSDWGQGRALFGGLVSAMGLRAARRAAPGWTPRSVMTSFSAPVSTDPLHARVDTLREGRSALFTEVRVVQGGAPRAVVLATFGAGRPESRALAGPPAPADAPRPDTLQAMPYIEGLVPTFTQHFEYRWYRGAFPYTGGNEPEFAGYVRLREDPIVDDAELVLALIDAWPCPALSVLDRFVPSSTVTWSVELAARPRLEKLDGWWTFESRARAAGEGFVQMSSMLWDPAGHMAAQSSQVAAIFD